MILSHANNLMSAAPGATAMGFFKKKPDPISDKARRLEEEIAALEAQIRSLSGKLPAASSTRDTPAEHPARTQPTTPPKASEAPVFEKVNLHRVTAVPEPHSPEQFNDLGVRKYDLAGAWHRLLHQFRGPDAHNPRLISYLASGTIQGLRPLRYEKRVARNRFVGLFLLLLVILWGVAYVFFRHR